MYRILSLLYCTYVVNVAPPLRRSIYKAICPRTSGPWVRILDAAHVFCDGLIKGIMPDTILLSSLIILVHKVGRYLWGTGFVLVQNTGKIVRLIVRQYFTEILLKHA